MNRTTLVTISPFGRKIRRIRTIIITILMTLSQFAIAQRHILTADDMDFDAETNTLKFFSFDLYNYDYTSIVVPDSVNGTAIKKLAITLRVFLLSMD